MSGHVRPLSRRSLSLSDRPGRIAGRTRDLPARQWDAVDSYRQRPWHIHLNSRREHGGSVNGATFLIRCRIHGPVDGLSRTSAITTVTASVRSQGATKIGSATFPGAIG